MRIYLKILIVLLLPLIIFYSNVYSEDKERKIKDPHKYNFYSGMFDFSDGGRRSSVIGFQHQNENLFRETFLGTISPVTGFMITSDNATYLYTGVQADYNIGIINFNPSISPGIYEQGDGKDLGNWVEIKTELQMSLDLPKNSEFGFKYNHISNAGFGEKNPGANSYMFNFSKNF
tara:strand:+ start:92 stop:616 length:525 start_codon:yes stop_codon:yes gene_type:complete